MWNSHFNNVLRVVIASVGFIGAIFFSPWIPAIVIVLLSLRWRAWEAMLLGYIMDCLWLPSGVPLFALGAITVVWLFEPLRAAFLVS